MSQRPLDQTDADNLYITEENRAFRAEIARLQQGLRALQDELRAEQAQWFSDATYAAIKKIDTLLGHEEPIMLCIVCHQRGAVVPDRNRPSPRKRVCRECHTDRLRTDLYKVALLATPDATTEDK